MQLLSYIAFTLLCSLSFLSSELSIQCNEMQYSWPVDRPKLCCNMCPPGQRMARRPDDSCKIECESCTGDRYIDSYNVEMSCSICRSCKKQNMVYKSNCTATRDAVCECKAGYRCKDQLCTQCVPMLYTTTTTTTLSPSTSTSTPKVRTTHLPPTKLITDTMWFRVIIVLLCIVIALAVVTKIRPILYWIKSKHCDFIPVKPAPEPLCFESEEVSKPVQEVCGKCDQRIDV